MNHVSIGLLLSFTAMVICLGLAIVSHDVVNSRLFAGLSLVAAVLTMRLLTQTNSSRYE
ncbi:MAG: hypothetical protein H6548_07525 [Chitinophagales bacterium]|nr:hypothetical protein [Chitinophagales bacterium]MCB9021950.1 hypothetical protein [Chitinophagales bacterium]MCB9030798.1 hypothetical protein [Chitinophagales bacterium]HPE97659.1 hypothetical protein [Chitinophagales bacterium]HQU39150.1 hypothetical protein [Chitinophagales bacterium]